MARIRAALADGSLAALKAEVLDRYRVGRATRRSGRP
jgi:hypothetical protein